MSKEPQSYLDEIHIEQLELLSRIGVREEERAKPQRLTVSISLWPRGKAGDLADDIEQTLNYSAVAEETKTFVRHQSLHLIETLADRIAIHLLKIFPAQRVTIEVRKFPLSDAKYVSARVTRIAAVD